MRIITKKTIVIFYTKHAGSKAALEEWHTKAVKANWSCFADIKNTFKTVDAVGNNRDGIHSIYRDT